MDNLALYWGGAQKKEESLRIENPALESNNSRTNNSMKESWEKMGSESKLTCVGFTLSLFLETSQYCNLLLLASVIMKHPSCPHPTHATASRMIFLYTFSSAVCNLALGQQLQHMVTCEGDSGSTGHSAFSYS